MNLRWNGMFHRFEAEFSTDFQGDYAAVKAAGFKTDGAPGWVWYTYKATPLTKLRENRPASGLSITTEAREQYTPMMALEEKNAAIKKELGEHNKALKKKLKIVEQEGRAFEIPEKGYLDASDLAPMPPSEKAYVAPPWPELKCMVCTAPIYFYETQVPPICLWCEKNCLDNAEQVC